MISSIEAIRAINTWRKDALVVSATAALREWNSVSQRRDLDLDISDCMDKASSIGLGVALARPGRKVLVLDCNSVLRSNLGSLVTIGTAGPENFVHFLLEDGSYTSTDGVPISGLDKVNFRALAEDGGYARTFEFNSLEDLVIGLEEVLEGPGPTFVSLKIFHDTELPSYPSRVMEASFIDVKQTLEQEDVGEVRA